MTDANVTVFGIRHHGPGCARSLRRALSELRPDVVLVEGPPDAQDQLAAIASEGLRPPVALLVHQADDPRRAAFYPFAEFSPEWQALRYAAQSGVPARFFDLPCMHRFGVDDATDDAPAASEPRDPMAWLAAADGYSDGERWWNDRIEERGDDRQLFAAIHEAIAALRAELALPESLLDRRREAWMRRTLRAVQREGFAQIAVVCGAWHAPALTQSTRAADDELLKGLSKVKVRATWTPWTHARLTSASGYGAGVVAPGWYAHLWHAGDDAVERWYARAARTLRDHDLAASSACVVEAVRLGTALASLRGRPSAGLPETLDSIRAVFGGGHDEVLHVLHDDLLVGDAFGELPDGLAQLPLEADLQAEQRRLRLKPTAAKATVELDLREPGGRARSVLLHRLCALRVPWGTKEGSGRTRGTFKEVWTLQWQPELALALVDASAFGNTIESAANARLVRADGDDTLPGLVSRLELALLSELHAASRALLAAVQAASATSTDAIALFDAVPPLCRLVRYGNVRDSDVADVRAIAIGLATRVHVALPAACVGIDDEAARSLGERLRDHDTAIDLLGEASVREAANATFVRIAHSDPAHAQLRGVAVRLLQHAGAMSATDVAVELERQLSAGAAPSDGAAWLDGLLAGSGALLAHDADLLRCVDAWVGRLGDEHFRSVLPLVRRTFATFSGPERLAIATAVRRCETEAPLRASSATDGFAIDGIRARDAVAAVARWFDLPEPEPDA